MGWSFALKSATTIPMTQRRSTAVRGAGYPKTNLDNTAALVGGFLVIGGCAWQPGAFVNPSRNAAEQQQDLADRSTKAERLPLPYARSADDFEQISLCALAPSSAR